MDMDFWIDSEELPGKLCSIAYDKSGQASEPRTDLLSPVTGIHKAASSNAQINP